MSECVVRMEMPESCYVCPCLDDYGDYPRCRISEEQRGYNFPIRKKRMPNCPIICQLPEGHGRLVDADEATEKLIHYGFRAIDMTVHECIEDEITTIVPAERREE